MHTKTSGFYGFRRECGFLVLAALLACGVASPQSNGSRGAPVSDLCTAFPDLETAARDFTEMFARGSADLDGDELPDAASLALVREVACNQDAPLSLAAATSLAYEANLAFFDSELNTAGLEGFREAIAALMLTNATTEAAVKAALALVDPPYTLSADYTQVTCTGGVCMPAPTRNTASTGEFIEFGVLPRAPDEPYAADGDLDGDTVTNLTEYNNILAQGGDLGDFVVAATSAELDGTEPVRGGGSGCFIATAAYGNPMAAQIDVLRTWRDRSLLSNPIGAAFSDAYYRVSPPIAGAVSNSAGLAQVVRALLVPIVAVLSGGTFCNLAGTLLIVGAIGILGARRGWFTFLSRRPRTARVR